MTRARYKVDPTRTLSLRRRFEADLVARFKKIRRLIIEAIVKDQALGDLSGGRAEPVPPRIIGHVLTHAVRFREFDFPRSDAKISAFMNWLESQVQAGVLETTTRARGVSSISGRWTDLYIDTAYRVGVRRAHSEMRRAGYTVPMGLEESFAAPVHADRVGVAYTRTFSSLRGITDAMDVRISQVLAQGLADGIGQASIARELAMVVDDIGINRAHTLARTEVVRAHHMANMQEYRNLGIAGVEVMAEWTTARDSEVCQRCKDMEKTASGKVRRYTLDEIESKIPLHPNCRCVAIPVLKEDLQR